MKSDRLVEEVLQTLPLIMKRMHATYSGFAEASGLTLGQMKALSYLYHNGRSTVGEVADGLGLAVPTASELIDKLAERDLVEREINPQNRRQIHVWLTKTANAFGREFHEMRRAQVRQAFTGLDPSEQDIVVRWLKALSDAVSLTSASDPSDPGATMTPHPTSPVT